jgi:ATP-dependent Clp protease adaptor protein ClpS
MLETMTRPAGDTLTRSKTETKTKTPPMYRVLLLNDDYTPMDFVVEVLVRYFRKTGEEATRIMLSVHQQGAGVCGVYAFEIAETKVAQVTRAARGAGYPLRCTLEPE